MSQTSVLAGQFQHLLYAVLYRVCKGCNPRCNTMVVGVCGQLYMGPKGCIWQHMTGTLKGLPISLIFYPQVAHVCFWISSFAALLEPLRPRHFTSTYCSIPYYLYQFHMINTKNHRLWTWLCSNFVSNFHCIFISSGYLEFFLLLDLTNFTGLS